MAGIDGKRIKYVGWEGGDRLVPGDGPEDWIEYMCVDFGDRGEDWIVAFRNGIEISRYNARYVSDIVWEEVEKQ